MFLAPTIASFYNNDAIILPLRVYAFSLIFGSFNSIQMAKMQRELRFKGMMYANIIATVLSGGVGIAMAYMDMGLWALVAYNFARIVFSCIVMFAFCRWLPSLKFSLQRAKVLLRYGWKILFSSLLSTVYADIRSLIIGKKYSTNDLGYYNRGQQVPNMVTSSVDAAVQGVMFPAMASKQDDKAEVKALL